MSRYVGGPFDGREAPPVTSDPANRIVDVPLRAKIGSRWATVSNYYRIGTADSDYHYEVSQFDWKPGMVAPGEEVEQ